MRDMVKIRIMLFFISAFFVVCIIQEWNPLLLLLVVFFLTTVIIADFYFCKYKQDKRASAKTTISNIEKVIKCEGYYPKRIGESKIGCEIGNKYYTIYYQAPVMRLQSGICYEDVDYSIALKAAQIITSNLMMGKIDVINLSNNNQVKIGITVLLEVIIRDVNELKINFRSYVNIVEIAILGFSSVYSLLEEDPQNTEESQLVIKNINQQLFNGLI